MAFFEFSKIFGFFVEPLNLLACLLLLALVLLWLGRVSGARRIFTTVVVLLFAVLLLPIGDLLLNPLEQRFPATPLPRKVDGIIMLGGAQRPMLTAAHHQPALNSAAERMTTFVALARQYPKARLVFSGGSGDIRHPNASEGETVRLFLTQQGLDTQRVIYESQSRNTYENVVNSHRLVSRKTNEKWLLVTSAADIPRAMGVFYKLGWQVIPVPCDYNGMKPDWSPGMSLIERFTDLNRAVHEWVGLVVYYLTDKTERLFPGPLNR